MALKLRLRRTYHSDHTKGVLYRGNDKFLRTIECPWRNNQPNISCVPPGTYTLTIHQSPRFGRCIALSAPSLGVTVEAETKSLRTHCLFHTANTASQLQGCIAPGKKFGQLDVGNGPEPAVLSSRNAQRELMSLLEEHGDEATLEISL